MCIAPFRQRLGHAGKSRAHWRAARALRIEPHRKLHLALQNAASTIIVDTQARQLYLVLQGGKAMRWVPRVGDVVVRADGSLDIVERGRAQEETSCQG